MANLVAPSFMKMSARRGLALHAEGESGEGLVPATVADARKMVEGTALSENKWRRIAPWIARHISDLDAVQGDEITPGLVAMLLWGGGSSKASARRAQAYAERIVAQLDATEERYDPDQPRDDDGKFGEGGGGDGGSQESDAPKISTTAQSVDTVKLKKDKSVESVGAGQRGTIAQWEVKDAEGNDVGTIKQVREKAPRYAPNPEANVTNFYAKPSIKITAKPKNNIEIDRHIDLKSSVASGKKEYALRDLINRHNQIVAINAAGSNTNKSHAEERAPAPKKDQIKGSDKNEPGSAEGKQGGIEISEETETALRNKLDEHNEKQADAPAWKRTTMGALKAVYRRGAGAFSTSHRPGMARNQWAMARVNAFLFLVRRGRPENPKYITDNDLLHKDHPKYSGKRYDPDQPREEDGKFGEGTGGGGDNGDGDEEGEGFSESFESAMEAETTVQSTQEKYVEQLDDIQKQAIDEYTGEGYRDVNRFYRGAPPPPLTEDEMEEISFTANMIEASIVEAPPLTEDVTVYRGMTAKALGIEVLEDGDQAFDGLVGSQFTDKGIISTSFSPDVATEFGGSDKVILEIKAPRGTTGLAVGDMSESYMESEFLLPPGTTFNITGVSRMKNQVILEVEAEN